MWISFALACALLQDSQDVVVPIKGLTAECCEKPVEKALAKIASVESVKLRKDGSLYLATLGTKEMRAVRFSEIDKALAEATREMGEAMGTKYEVDGSLGVEFVHYYLAKEDQDPEALRKALRDLPGYANAKGKDKMFQAWFVGPKLPTFGDVRKAVPLEDAVLAPTQDGKRYLCPKHPDRVSAVPAKCPDCSADMEGFDVSQKKTESKKGG